MSLQISDKKIDAVGINIELENDNNPVSITDGFVVIDKQMNNLGSSTNPINRTVAIGDQPLVGSEMNKTLDVLNAIEKACDAQTKAQLNLDQKTQHVGTVRNLFYKFLGLFSKSLETEKRTQALNTKLHSVATRLKNNKNLYNGVLLSTLNDLKLDASLNTIVPITSPLENDADISNTNIRVVEGIASTLFPIIDSIPTQVLYSWGHHALELISEGNTVCNLTPLCQIHPQSASFFVKKLNLIELLRIVFLDSNVTDFNKGSIQVSIPHWLFGPVWKLHNRIAHIHMALYRRIQRR